MNSHDGARPGQVSQLLCWGQGKGTLPDWHLGETQSESEDGLETCAACFEFRVSVSVSGFLYSDNLEYEHCWASLSFSVCVSACVHLCVRTCEHVQRVSEEPTVYHVALQAARCPCTGHPHRKSIHKNGDYIGDDWPAAISLSLSFSFSFALSETSLCQTSLILFFIR